MTRDFRIGSNLAQWFSRYRRPRGDGRRTRETLARQAFHQLRRAGVRRLEAHRRALFANLRAPHFLSGGSRTFWPRKPRRSVEGPLLRRRPDPRAPTTREHNWDRDYNHNRNPDRTRSRDRGHSGDRRSKSPERPTYQPGGGYRSSKKTTWDPAQKKDVRSSSSPTPGVLRSRLCSPASSVVDTTTTRHVPGRWFLPAVGHIPHPQHLTLDAAFRRRTTLLSLPATSWDVGASPPWATSLIPGVLS